MLHVTVHNNCITRQQLIQLQLDFQSAYLRQEYSILRNVLRQLFLLDSSLCFMLNPFADGVDITLLDRLTGDELMEFYPRFNTFFNRLLAISTPQFEVPFRRNIVQNPILLNLLTPQIHHRHMVCQPPRHSHMSENIFATRQAAQPHHYHVHTAPASQQTYSRGNGMFDSNSRTHTHSNSQGGFSHAPGSFHSHGHH